MLRHYWIWNDAHGFNKTGWESACACITGALPVEIQANDVWNSKTKSWKSKLPIGKLPKNVTSSDDPEETAARPKNEETIHGVHLIRLSRQRIVYMRAGTRFFAAQVALDDDMEYSYEQCVRLVLNVEILFNLHPEIAPKSERKNLVPAFVKRCINGASNPPTKGEFAELMKPGQVR